MSAYYFIGMIQSSTKAVVQTIIAIGLLVPCLTGIGVKLYLDAHSQPTIDWSDVLNPVFLLLLIPSAIYWAAPFIVLALVAHRVLDVAPLARQTRLTQLLLACFGFAGAVFSYWFGVGGSAVFVLAFVVCGLMSWSFFALLSSKARLLFILGGVAGGTVGAVQTFVTAWIDMESISFGFFVWPFVYLSKMTLGLLLGYAAGKAIDLAYKSEV